MYMQEDAKDNSAVFVLFWLDCKFFAVTTCVEGAGLKCNIVIL